jgi:polyadenylation factor subunit 2
MMQFGYRPQLRLQQPQQMQQQQQMGAVGEVGFDGKMLRKAMARKTVDFNASFTRHLENRIWQRDYRDAPALQADPLYAQQLPPPQGMLDNPISFIMTKFIRAALNKDPRPIFCVSWTPDGRRLITGASSGEFTLWNGLTFNFETILQAHTSSVRSMIWSHNEQWMLSGDDKGYIKYWQTNMNNVQMYQGHLEAIRGLSFAPSDSKFASCSDDRTVRIFDFVTCKEESILQGHGSDVKCVDWHPYKGLVISGSKDSQQPIILWDVKSAKKITTLHAHKNTCTDLKWNRFNGNWLISSSRDHLCKLFDLRNLKEEVQIFRGHRKDACTLAWHPIHEKLFVSGGGDGSMFFWLCGSDKELGALEDAHESIIWDVTWHPLGHMLVSGSNDRSTRFWTRNRPGDTVADKSDELFVPKIEKVTGIIFKNVDMQEFERSTEDGLIHLPGLGMEKNPDDQMTNDFGFAEPDNERNEKAAVKPHSAHHHHHHHHHHHRTPKKEGMIPGLDFDDEESRRRKAPYSKPIPKDFEKAWKSNKPIIQSGNNSASYDDSMGTKSFGANIKGGQSSVRPLMNISAQPLMQPMALMDLKPKTSSLSQNKDFDKKGNYQN